MSDRAVFYDTNGDLAIIVGACDLLEETFAEKPEVAARIQAIKATARHIAETISNDSLPGLQNSAAQSSRDQR